MEVPSAPVEKITRARAVRAGPPSPCRHPPFPHQARDRRPSPSKPKPPPLTATAVEDIRPPAPYAPCREPRDLPVTECPRPDRRLGRPALDQPIDAAHRRAPWDRW